MFCHISRISEEIHRYIIHILCVIIVKVWVINIILILGLVLVQCSLSASKFSWNLLSLHTVPFSSTPFFLNHRESTNIHSTKQTFQNITKRQNSCFLDTDKSYNQTNSSSIKYYFYILNCSWKVKGCPFFTVYCYWCNGKQLCACFTLVYMKSSLITRINFFIVKVKCLLICCLYFKFFFYALSLNLQGYVYSPISWGNPQTWYLPRIPCYIR